MRSVAEIQAVRSNGARDEPLLGVRVLLELERRRLVVFGRAHAEKQRARVRREIRREMLVEATEIELRVAALEHNRRHAGLPLAQRHRDTVHVGLADPRKRSDDFAHVVRRDVLALPTEGIARAVHEKVEALVVDAEEVPRRPPQVALLKHVAVHLPQRRVVVDVTIVTALVEGHQQLALLPRMALDAQAVLIARERAGGDIVRNNAVARGSAAEARRHKAAAAHAVRPVQHGCAGHLGRPVVLHDALDAVARANLRPNVAAQSVADNYAERVVGVVRVLRLHEKVPPQLPNVDGRRARVLADVGEKVARGELGANDGRRARVDHRGHGDNHRVSVVEGQRDVVTVRRRQLARGRPR
eukprot:Opistho-1_new@94068